MAQYKSIFHKKKPGKSKILTNQLAFPMTCTLYYFSKNMHSSKVTILMEKDPATHNDMGIAYLLYPKNSRSNKEKCIVYFLDGLDFSIFKISD